MDVIAELPLVAPEQKEGEEKLTSKVITIANQKGGAGKTTVMMTLAESLQRRGFHVLGLDIDKQAAASKWEARPKKGFARFSVRVEKLLMRGDIKSVTDFYRALLGFAKAYAAMHGQQPDFILIDTPPDVDSPELSAALLVSDLTIMPFKASGQFVNAAEETLVLFSKVDEVRRAHKRKPLTIRLVRNFWTPSRPLPVSIFTVFQKRLSALKGLNIRFFDAALKDLVAFEDASCYQTGIYSLPGTTPARKSLEELADEVLEELK